MPNPPTTPISTPTPVSKVPCLTFEHRLKMAEVEVQLIQSRFDKFDQLFQGNRRLAVAITAAAFAASAALDQRTALLASAGVTIVLLALEWFQRRTLFAKLVERHLLLRAALNDPERLARLVIYDPFNDTAAAVPAEWRAEKANLFTYEMLVFYLTLAAVPVAAALLMPTPK